MTEDASFQEAWEALDPVEKREVILAHFPARDWCEESTLNVLAVFFPNAVQWMRIKARAKEVGVNPYDLERAVRQIRGRHATWKMTHTPSANGHVLGQDPAQVAWRATLIDNTRGEPSQNAFNISTILRHHQDWAGAFWFDSVRQRPMVHNDALSDQIVTNIATWLGANMRMGVNNLRFLERCIVALCQEHPRDLLQEWLEGLPGWDRTPRLRTWLSEVAGTETTDYGQFVSCILPVSMVARALEPGVMHRYVVILEGLEELKKSTLVRALGGDDWTVELSLGLDSKESHMLLQGAWLAELPELNVMSRTEDPRLKAFVSSRRDSFIPKYSNLRVDIDRRTIFIGTTNEGVYLKGQTGNTRFLPIKVTKLIDDERFQAEREQIFAEALLYYYAHTTDWWQMSATADAEAKEQREERRIPSVYEETLRQWLDYPPPLPEMPSYTPTPRQEITWQEIGEGFLKIDKEKWKDPNLQRQIATALRAIGWEQRREGPKNERRRIWRRGP
jgi:putative DNA primase/helicase